MTMSMKPIKAGDGYKYLLRSVVVNDGNRTLDSPLTRYYTDAGTPPGRWLGSGLNALGQGQIVAGSEVTESQLKLLLGEGRDPVTGQMLGRAFRRYPSEADRVAKRIAGISPYLSAEERDGLAARIRSEEKERGSQVAVAGFDCTFSVPKSVSTLWAVADAATQELILAAHHEAICEVLDLFEREVAFTRKGVSGPRGAVTQVPVNGVIAAAFDHWDSRTHDPQLHTHVVISNKVKTAEDGCWRSLDGTPVHEAGVALSEFYNGVLADRMAERFGVGWEARERGKDRNPAWEIAGVPDALVSEFSRRTRAIDVEKDRLIAEHVAMHGRQPSRRTIIKLRSQATVATRPEKEIKSLDELAAGWRERASAVLKTDAAEWSGGILDRQAMRGLSADDIPLDVLVELGQSVVAAVSERRATWRYWNLWAEASRQTMGWRFASVASREETVAVIVDAATRASVSLTPPDLAATPEKFQRDDGSSRFRRANSTIHSSVTVLGAEARLLDRADNETAPTVDSAVVEGIVGRAVDGQMLSDEQANALAAICTSGRCVDLLIGPAGAGKTTAMRALRNAWIIEHGPTGVVGLAPSAVAADVLASDLGISCETTAKWLHQQYRGDASLEPGQLVIVDEATLAGTLALDRLTEVASDAGAKVLLVGDWAQLQSVDAGGAFSMLCKARSDAPELIDVRRFTHEWEKHASLELRSGRTEAVSIYMAHRRVCEGTTDDMLHEAYSAWRADVLDGAASVLVTESANAVTSLNERARAERISTGETEASREVELSDGNRASAGDLIITRRNDRRMRTRVGGFVRNGDRWVVVDVRRDGAVVARREGRRLRASVALPSNYVKEYVDLGYAVTAHRAQGITVDTSHVVVTSSTTRQNLYVSMTRGRDSNIAYVALDQPDGVHSSPPDEDVSARSVLHGVLRHSGAELSAHDSIEAEQERWSSIAQISAEYETIGAEAQHDRWVGLLSASGLSEEQVEAMVASDSFGPLAAGLRRAEADNYDLATLIPKLAARRSLQDAEDVGAVLLDRLRHATAAPKSSAARRQAHLIAGLIPKVKGVVDDDIAQALREREELIEARALALVESAIESKAEWLQRLGTVPSDTPARTRWIAAAVTVAAYRDRHQVDERSALGSRPQSIAQRLDHARAVGAVKRAEGIARQMEREVVVGGVGEGVALPGG